MATSTQNYGYPKPDETDFYDIGQFNQAMDMIDGDMKKTADDLSALDAKKADSEEVKKHEGNIVVHITEAEREAWNRKQDASTAVIGVKGNVETDYRKGSVNLTPANIGAIGAKYASYWGITDPDGADDVFIRATSKGFLPYQPGRPGGNEPVSDIGSSSNYFRNSYIKSMLCNGLEALNLVRIYGQGIQIDASNTGGFAKGFIYKTYGNTATQGGIGALGSAEGGFHTLYMGLGTQPYNSTAKGIHINEEGNTLIGNTTVDGTLTASSFLGNATSATKASKDGNGDVIEDTYAKKSIYGDDAVSMGRKPDTTVGIGSFAFGTIVEASGGRSHAEGFYTTASGDYSHSEGYYTTASGGRSHAEGSNTTASGGHSHAEGSNTTASGDYSHSEGYITKASNYASHASGKYNAAMTTGGSYSNTTGTAFAIGNGTSSSALSNAFSVAYTGVVKAKSTITGSTTADYAEFFEWADGNPDGEDRVGKFVTIRGNKISIAKSNEDYILGIVSGEPFVLGNGDCDTWNGMFLRDEFNRTIYEPAPKMEIDEETGKEKEVFDEEGNVVYEGTRPKLNPEFDYTKKYIPRSDRPEWAPVGMLGVLSVIHDGTCQVDGYCCCNSEGIATACEKGTEGACRVIEEVSENVVRVILK